MPTASEHSGHDLFMLLFHNMPLMRTTLYHHRVLQGSTP